MVKSGPLYSNGHEAPRTKSKQVNGKNGSTSKPPPTLRLGFLHGCRLFSSLSKIPRLKNSSNCSLSSVRTFDRTTYSSLCLGRNRNACLPITFPQNNMNRCGGVCTQRTRTPGREFARVRSPGHESLLMFLSCSWDILSIDLSVRGSELIW